MFGSSMVDIAVGVVFIFLLLSVFATTINEIILSLLSMRGKFLLRGIQILLDDEFANGAAGNGLVDKVYTHGQVFGLFDGKFNPSKPGNLPSYIPASNFAIALLDAVAGWTIPPGAQAAAAAPDAARAPASFAALLNGGGAAAAAQPPSVTPVTVTQDFKNAVRWMAADPKTEKVGKPLLSMLALAGDDANKLRRSVEDWFNSGMDRVSGKYKYRTQWTLFWIGLIIAVALNADTIGIVRQLSRDQTQRQAIVAAAESFKSPEASAGSADTALAARMTTANKTFDQIQTLGIPLGWPAEAAGTSWSQRVQNDASLVGRQPAMILGWLLTAVAVCLGAPFWFDALNKIIVVRSTVKPKEKSPEEGSKDKR